MRTLPVARMVLAAGMFLVAIPIVSAAPAPQPTAASLDKYLLDDTDFLVVVEVKKILASPLFAKQFRPLVENFLKSEAAQVWLKDAGFDPLRDIDRVLVVMDRNSHPSQESLSSSGPVVLLQGRFNKDKLQAKMSQLIKDAPQGVKVEEQGEGVYRVTLFGPQFFLAQLDRNTLILTEKKERIVEAQEKASGKKKTALKYPSVRAFLKQRKSDQAVQIVADADFIGSTQYAVKGNGGAVIREVKHTTLGDMGILSLLGNFTVGDKIKGGVTLKTADADKAKERAAKVQAGLDQAKTELAREVQRHKELEPVAKILDAITIEPREATVRISGEMEGDAIRAAFSSWFMARSGAVPPPTPPLPPRKR